MAIPIKIKTINTLKSSKIYPAEMHKHVYQKTYKTIITVKNWKNLITKSARDYEKLIMVSCNGIPYSIENEIRKCNIHFHKNVEYCQIKTHAS